MPAIMEVSEGRVLLSDVSWASYEALLRDSEQSNGSRITFDRGCLEIMSPLLAHEGDNRNLQMIVEIIAEEWRIETLNAGSVTLKRQDMARGLEPDSCFYIQNVEAMVGKETVDLDGGDMAPDLVIEVDVTSSSLNKLAMYATLGVPEVWRLSRGTVTIFGLAGATYQEYTESIAFPRLSQATLDNFIAQSHTMRRLDWLHLVRAWASENSGESS